MQHCTLAHPFGAIGFFPDNAVIRMDEFSQRRNLLLPEPFTVEAPFFWKRTPQLEYTMNIFYIIGVVVVIVVVAGFLGLHL